MNLGLLASLQSKRPHDRLTAARELTKYAVPADMEKIQVAIAVETVPWVKTALIRALDRLVPYTTIADEPGLKLENFSDAIARDIALKNGEEIASAFMHEILPKLGFIRNSARKEIEDFESSETFKRIDSLEQLLNLIGKFRSVSKTPTISEFDLHDLIETIELEHRCECHILLAGPKTLIVQGEPVRVHLAVSNGIRNAIDATRQLVAEDQGPIVISWGSTDSEYWISIVDSGIGLTGNISGMFNIGSSTKAGDHFGMGLPLAKQAISSLDGNVTLTPPVNGGARFEIKWPRIIEQSKESE